MGKKIDCFHFFLTGVLELYSYLGSKMVEIIKIWFDVFQKGKCSD